MGVPADRVLLCEDGDQVVLTDDGLRKGGRVPAGYLYVDGLGIGDVGHGVLRDRKVLADEGVVVVIVAVDLDAQKVVLGPEVITRGWVHAAEAEDMLEECRKVVREDLEQGLRDDAAQGVEQLSRIVRRSAGRFVNDRTRRRPMIVPVVMES
jgi:ribonuclease J